MAPWPLVRVRTWLGVPDVAIDLGTARTRLAAVGRRSIVTAPSCAVDDPGAPPRRPLRGGVVVEPDVAARMLRPLLARLRRAPWLRPRALALAPSDASPDERRVLRDAVRAAGAGRVAIAPEPMAAAIGAGVDAGARWAEMVVDVGDGVTDVSVIRDGRLAWARALRVGCGDLRAALVRCAAEHCELRIADVEAERLLRVVGLAPETPEGRALDVAGRPARAVGSQRRLLPVDTARSALWGVAGAIVAHVARCVRDLPDALGCEVVERPLTLTGGGALVRGLPPALSGAAGLDTRVAADPLDAVIRGARLMLEQGDAVALWEG